MTNALKRYFALLLSCILLLSTLVPVAANAEGNAETPQPTTQAVAVQTAEPTAESTQAPTNEPTPTPTNESTQTPMSEPTQALTTEPTVEPSAAQEPGTEASAQPTDATTAEPSAEITPEPTPSLCPVVSLDAGEITLYIGKTRALTALLEPADADSSFLWTSSDEAVATVDASGVVLAVSPGIAVVALTAQDGSGLAAECVVTVLRPISSLAVAGQARIQVGKSYPLAALDGEIPIAQDVLVWTSSDEAIATVDASGIVTGVSIGTATITATARDGSGLTFGFPVEILRATVVIRTNSNKQFSIAVSENNEEAEGAISSMSRMARDGSMEFVYMRLVLKTDGTDPAIDDFNPDVIIANKDNRYIVQFTTPAETEAAYDALSVAGYVKYVEPDSMTSISETQTTSYNSWGVEAMGAEVASEYLATTTSGALKVGVVDTGISPHSFIGSKLINGYDYVDSDTNPADENGHGTHVAGTIIDLTQPLNVSVVAYRTFDRAGNGYTSNITNAIMVAADDGCKVINLSARGVYSTNGFNAYSNAISYATGKGAVFCCAAGNDSLSTSNFVPACITSPGCVVVASVGESLSHSYFSNSGSSVDVSGPGEFILSCDYEGGYCYMSGTSMATPHISAACAIIRLAHPGYGPSQVENALKEMCDDLGSPGYDTTYGYGIPDLTSIAPTVPTGVVVTAPQGTLSIGSSMQLTATVSPATANQAVTWTSSNTSVMTVSASGSVTAVAPGTARITAKTVNDLTGYVELTVPYDAATGVAVTAPLSTLSIGSSMQLTVTVSPATANQAVTWTSSNTSVMTVSASGFVTAVAPGTARITAKTVNDLSGYVDLTVPYDAATNITVSAPQSTIPMGGGMQFSATVSPATANPAVTWSSSNTGVLNVSAGGYVTPVAVGTARVTAKTVNNLTGYVDLTVTYDAATGVVVTAPGGIMTLSSGMQLSATVSPATADQTVTWSSSNAGVLTVSASGYVTPIAVGTARVTAKTVNNLSGYVDLTVPYDVATNITVFAPQSTIPMGGGMQLSATVSPATANPAVTWSSSNAGVLTVSADGYVTPVAVGTARVTAKTVNNLSGYVDLTVTYDAATGVVVAAPGGIMTLSSGMQLSATVSPATANPSVTWSSSNAGVLTVSAGGYVTPVAVGTARVTAKTTNNLTGYVDLTVAYDAATGVVVTAPGGTFTLSSGMQLSATVSPATADQVVTWSSSNVGVLTISVNGYVTPVAVGTARVTAKTTNNLTGYVDLTVAYDAATGVVVTAPGDTFTLSSGMQLSATVSPATANPAVTWLSSNAGILTVSAGGYVTPVAVGTARVTAKTTDNLIGYVDLTVTYDAATSVIVSAPHAELTVGKGTQLVAAVFPSTANPAVAWSSSSEGVVTVSPGGYASAVGVGTAQITATTVGNLTGQITLTVDEAPSDFVIDAPRTSAPVGITFQLYPQIPVQVASETRAWSSSNAAVMTVDENGIASTLSPGDVRITLTAGTLIGYIDLTVTSVVPASVAITVPASGTILLGTIIDPAATVLPADANQAVTWSSSNPGVILNQQGRLWAVGIGTARITATTVNNQITFMDVTVIGAPPTGISVGAPKTIVEIGEQMQLTATLTPTNADPAVTWASSDESVLTVSQSGVATGIKSGTVRVTAQASNMLTAFIDLTVGARISETSVVIGKNKTWQLSVTGAAGAVAWSSSNPKIATVSSTGRIQGRAYGWVDITASVDGLTFQCRVKVSKPVLSTTSFTISALRTYKLSVSYPAGSVRWSSSRTSVATVNSSGKVTARKAGTATIYASVDGFRLKCTVTVKTNGHSYYVDLKAKNNASGATIAVSKVYYSGSTIYIDIYLINNYSKKTIYRIETLKMWVYDEETNTLLAAKKFTKIYANLKPGKVKKITIKFTGSATYQKAYELRLRTQSFALTGSLSLR